MSFQEHGEYNVVADGEIILILSSGDWNLEAFTHINSIINSHIEKNESDKFSIIAHTVEITGVPPNVIQGWLKVFPVWSAKGFGAGCIVDNPSSIKSKMFFQGLRKH